MASYPKDRFDELPDDIERIGAHRGPAPRGRGWIGFAWAFLATGVLVLGGLFALSQYLDDDLGIPFFASPEETAPAPEPTQTVQPVTDPTAIDPARAIVIDVLNGTDSDGLQERVLAELLADEWPVGSAAPASERDIAETFIYYANPSDEDVAAGVAAKLGIGQLRLVDEDVYPAAQVTIVLGGDYLALASATTEEPGE